MRIPCRGVAFGVFVLLTLGAITAAQAGGRELYVDNCSMCHGVIATDSSERSRIPAATGPLMPWRAIPTSGSSEPRVRVALGAGWPEVAPRDRARVAIAPPYGPPLRGVYGRPAGSVPGFSYSAEFLKVLQGVVWNRKTLDTWISDSQGWVPGSVMYYKQPDPEIRRQIIDYLETAK